MGKSVDLTMYKMCLKIKVGKEGEGRQAGAMKANFSNLKCIPKARCMKESAGRGRHLSINTNLHIYISNLRHTKSY